MCSGLEKRKRRLQVESALLTGSILTDYISPLYKGNFNIFLGNINKGQKLMLMTTAFNFLSENNNNYVIYITFNKLEASKLENFAKANNKSNLKIFTLSNNPSESEYYYLPRLALNYIKIFCDKIKPFDKKSILVCFDDFTTYVYKEKRIFENSKSFFVNILKFDNLGFNKHFLRVIRTMRKF